MKHAHTRATAHTLPEMSPDMSLLPEPSPAPRRTHYRFASSEVPAMRTELARLQTVVEAQRQMIETLQSQAMSDPLTGLLNRRGFEAALHAILADHTRYGYKGAVISLDLNHFKWINDTFGHAAGDALLKHVSRLLERHTRETDLRARLGGDEFVIVLKEANAEEANKRAHALAALFQSMPCHWRGVSLPVSASIGVATFAEAPVPANLLALADRRMYQAKHRAHAKN